MTDPMQGKQVLSIYSFMKVSNKERPSEENGTIKDINQAQIIAEPGK